MAACGIEARINKARHKAAPHCVEATAKQSFSNDTEKSLIMSVKRVATGQMWRDGQSGENYVVTTLFKEVLSSYAILRAANSSRQVPTKRVKIVKTPTGETLVGFTEADQV